jgi:hypothetical protein
MTEKVALFTELLRVHQIQAEFQVLSNERPNDPHLREELSSYQSTQYSSACCNILPLISLILSPH